MVTKLEARLGHSQDPETLNESPFRVAGTEALEPSAAAFPCISMELDLKWTSQDSFKPALISNASITG